LIAVSLLLCAFVSVGYASEKYTFVSADINSGSSVPKSLGDNYYTDGFYAKILNLATYNDTDGSASQLSVHIKFVNQSSVESACMIELVMYNDTTLTVKAYIDGASGEVLYSNSGVDFLGKDDYLQVRLDSNGNLNVGNSSDRSAFVEDFGFGAFNCTYLVGIGSPACAVESGYVSVELGLYGGDYTSSIMSWMPIIVEFAMLGMVLGMLKKFQR